MKKSTYLFILAILLTMIGIVEAVSGFVIWFAFPSGGGRGNLDLSYLGLSHHSWLDIHDFGAIALTILVVIHLLLHWKWVLNMTKSNFSRLRMAYALSPKNR